MIDKSSDLTKYLDRVVMEASLNGFSIQPASAHPCYGLAQKTLRLEGQMKMAMLQEEYSIYKTKLWKREDDFLGLMFVPRSIATEDAWRSYEVCKKILDIGLSIIPFIRMCKACECVATHKAFLSGSDQYRDIKGNHIPKVTDVLCQGRRTSSEIVTKDVLENTLQLFWDYDDDDMTDGLHLTKIKTVIIDRQSKELIGRRKYFLSINEIANLKCKNKPISELEDGEDV